MGIGVADITDNIVLTDSTHITLQPGFYSIFYEVSVLYSGTTYMQITPSYNGSSHIEYGLYFMTGPGTEGTLTMVIFKLRRES